MAEGRTGRSGGGPSTRERILAAARDQAVEEGFAAFTMERVAERAGVSRMTVYYQFGSKQELLEALFDEVAGRSRMDRLTEVFSQRDPLEALSIFIAVFCDLWGSDRVGIRRLRGWATLDPAFEKGARSREEWRREGLELIVGRVQRIYATPPEGTLPEVVDVLHTLTSFETFDSLSRGGRGESEVAGVLTRISRSILGMPA